MARGLCPVPRLRTAHGDADYREWPAALQLRFPEALAQAGRELAESVGEFRFSQFLLKRQQRRLLEYARQKHVKLIGDVPFLVAPNSADVWAHPELFLLAPDGTTTFVAGVPPDYFGADGQLWGNPLYRWDVLEKHGVPLVDRPHRRTCAQVDMVRLDHFAFAAAWHIPANSATARVGEWRPGPGAEFFKAAERVLGPLPVIAEDLGLITADVGALRDELHFPGMRVLQFAFDGDSENLFLPENYPEGVVAYTGTHDNNTARGWYESLTEEERTIVRDYLGRPDESGRTIAWELIRRVWKSRAALAIAPYAGHLEPGRGSPHEPAGTRGGQLGLAPTAEQVASANFERLRELTVETNRAR